jgi:hypothetical protein
MTPKKPGWEERASEFEVSFINQPVEVDFVVEPEAKTAREIANRRWGMEQMAFGEANDKR